MANAQTADGLVMNTPTLLATCQNASLSWTNAPKGPVFVSVVPGGQLGAAPLVQFNATDSSQGHVTWLVDLPADNSVTVLITDMNGQSTGSAQVTIKKGVDTSCVGKGQSVHPGNTSAAPSTSTSTSPGSTGSTSGSSTSSTSTGSKTASSTGSATNTTTTSTSSPSTSSSTTGATTPSTSSSSTPASDSTAHSTDSTSSDTTTTAQPSVDTTSASTAKTDGAVALQHQALFALGITLLSSLFMVVAM